MKNRYKTFWKNHSLSIVVFICLQIWILIYFLSDENTHFGSFFGNAVSDWFGVFCIIIITKYLYEQGSSESKEPPPVDPRHPIIVFLDKHSLTIFLFVTGLIWFLLFNFMQSDSKWGQIVGNILSEWTQIFAMVVMTKRLLEKGSKESDGK